MEGLDFTESGIMFWVFGCRLKFLKILLIGARKSSMAMIVSHFSVNGIRKRNGMNWHALTIAVNMSTQGCNSVGSQKWWHGLQQAVGRARLNRLANTVIVFSNVLIPDFTGRAVGFVPEDLEVAAGLDNLETVALARLEAEQDAPQQEKKTARKKEQETRGLKAAQKETALALYDAGVSATEISKRVGVSRRTIFNWFEKRGF